MTQPDPARILVVEDDDGKRYTLVRHLRACGFETFEASTGEAGLALARAQQPDLMVLDVHLPDTNGFDVCRTLKLDPATSGILVLALSARFSGTKHRVRGLEEGADAYIAHPVELTELTATLQSLLRLRNSERERAQLSAEMAASEERHRTITSTATVGLCRIDAQGFVRFVNPAAEALLGAKQAELGARTLFDALHASPSEELRIEDWAITRVMQSREPVRDLRETVENLRGASFPVRLTASPLIEHGRCVGAVVEIKDDSEAVLAERTRELFLGALGHDLRNPLQTFEVGCQLLGVAELPPPQRKALGRMQNSVRRMSRLIEQTLMLAQSLVDDLPLDLAPCDLTAVLRSAASGLDDRKPDSPIVLQLPDTATGNWDHGRMLQVFDNLLGNAQRHGSGPITVSLTDRGSDVSVSLHNGGPPITPSAMATLFDPFRRGGGASGGVGLGLYIVDQIVRAHGGHVDVTSTQEAGTTFTVTVPREPRRPSAPPPP